MEERQSTYEEEISLRDLILKTGSYIREVFRYWYIPAFCIVVALSYQAYRYFEYIPVYPAKITFSVDEDEGGGASGLTGILGQFGLGSVRPSRFNLDKILALSKSRRVIEKTLFARITIDGQEDFIANHLIREYELKNDALPPTEDPEPYYFTHDSLPAFDRAANNMLLILYTFVIGPPDDPKKALAKTDYNEDTNIMSLEISTTNETLSLELAQRMFESLSNYYINKSIEKQFKTYTVVSTKRDSVLAVLKSTEYQLANFRDANRGLHLRTDQLAELRLQREIAALSAMYAEVIKNTEIADFGLKNKTPFIQVIDAPISPIQPVRMSILRKMLIGIFIGGVIGGLFVVGRRILRDAFTDNMVSA